MQLSMVHCYQTFACIHIVDTFHRTLAIVWRLNGKLNIAIVTCCFFDILHNICSGLLHLAPYQANSTAPIPQQVFYPIQSAHHLLHYHGMLQVLAFSGFEKLPIDAHVYVCTAMQLNSEENCQHDTQPPPQASREREERRPATSCMRMRIVFAYFVHKIHSTFL